MPLPAPPAPSDPRSTQRYILDLDRRLEKFDRAILAAEWDLFTGRSRRGSETWQVRRAELLSDPRLLEWVRRALQHVEPPLVHRRLELLERILLDTHVEQDPEIVRRRSAAVRRLVAFRPEWKGRRVERSVVLRAMRESTRETERRTAYYASEPVHRALEGTLRELVRLRNDRARALGFRSFAHLRLGFLGLTPERLEELSASAMVPAPAAVRALRDRYQAETGSGSWHPWDFSHARELRVPLPATSFPRRGMLPRILAAVAEWGFRTDRMHFRLVYHDLPAGGLTLAPDPPRDVRILVHPQGGWLAHLGMFHEVGHAVHSASIRAPRHLLRWHENVPGFGAFHEGIGALFEELANNADWLAGRPGISRGRAEAFERSARDAVLLEAPWHASWFGIEQALYRAPDRDPMEAIQRRERRLFGYDDYRPLSFVDSFFIKSPIYAQNYLLASLFARQLAETLRERFGSPIWPNRKVGPWLAREWFAPGSIYDWIPRVRELTGRPYGAEAFRRSVAPAG